MTDSITINSTTIDNIVSMEVILNDLDKDSTRNALGGLIRNRIAQVPEIRLTFGIQTKTQMETLLSLLKLASFSVTYYLPHTQQEKTGNFYAGSYSPKLLNGNPNYYDFMEVSLIGYNGI